MPTGRCPHCKRDTIFVPISMVEPLGGTDNKQGLKRGTLSLDRCGHANCQAVVYREHNPNDNEDEWDIYPPNELRADDELPGIVKRSYGEALANFAGGQWNSSVQASRRALQDALSLMPPKDVEKKAWLNKSLKRKIVDLVDTRSLPPSLGEWAEETRAGEILAVHGEEFDDYWATEQDAKEILEFTKWVFRYMFVLPEQLKKRRERLEQDS